MGHLGAFLQDHLLLALIAVVAIVVVWKIVKTLIRWVIIIAVLGAILIYGFNYTPESLKAAGHQAVQLSKEEALKVLADEMKEAKYSQEADGTFVIQTPDLKLSGKVGSDTAKLTYKGLSMDIKIDQALQAFIEQVKKN